MQKLIYVFFTFVSVFGVKYNHSENSTYFVLQVQQVCALAFVPVHDVVYAFKKLIESEYYINTNIWNSYENVSMKRPRTNNAVEGWHNAFRFSIGVHQKYGHLLILLNLYKTWWKLK